MKIAALSTLVFWFHNTNIRQSRPSFDAQPLCQGPNDGARSFGQILRKNQSGPSTVICVELFVLLAACHRAPVAVCEQRTVLSKVARSRD